MSRESQFKTRDFCFTPHDGDNRPCKDCGYPGSDWREDGADSADPKGESAGRGRGEAAHSPDDLREAQIAFARKHKAVLDRPDADWEPSLSDQSSRTTPKTPGHAASPRNVAERQHDDTCSIGFANKCTCDIANGRTKSLQTADAETNNPVTNKNVSAALMAENDRLRCENAALSTWEARCTVCKEAFTLAIGFPARAPHGKNQCTANSWERVYD